MINFSEILRNGQNLADTPPMLIKVRETDIFVVYNKNKTRLDRIAYDIYKDETYWKIILMANPEYFCEYDIPDNTVIRVPSPLISVVQEVVAKLNSGKNRDNLQV